MGQIRAFAFVEHSIMIALANLSLQKRIGLLVLGGLVVGLGLFSWLGIQSVNDSVKRTLEERLTIARVMASHLDENIEHILMHLQNTSDFDGRLPTEEEFGTVADSLQETLAASGVLARTFIIIDRDGKVLQAEPAEDSRIIGTDMSLHSEVNETLETGLPTISGLTSSPLIEVPVVLISVPILNKEGRTIGTLSTLIDIERSSIGALGQTTTVGKTGYTEIVDGNGVILA